MFWTPLSPTPDGAARVFGNFVAMLKPGVSREAATQEANVIGAAVRTPTPVTGYGAGAAPRRRRPRPAPRWAGRRQDLDASSRPRFEVFGVKDLLVSPIRPALRVLGFAVALVLLIVCANVANLLLARGTARQP